MKNVLIRRHEYLLKDIYSKLNGTWELFCGDKYVKIYKGLKTTATNFIINSNFLTQIPNNYKIIFFREHDSGIPFTRALVIKDDKDKIIIRMYNPQEVSYTD